MGKFTSGIFFLLAVYTVRSDSTNATTLPCGDGWVSYNNYCYLFNNKKWINRDQAANECDQRDASLLYLSNMDELNWFKQTVRNHSSAGYWTSLNDLSNTGTGGTGLWKWGMYSAVDMSLISWNQSPVQDGHSECAGINVQGKMEDISCYSRQGYICKYSPGDDSGCPLGWLPTDTACYWISNITDPSQRLVWSDAKTKCASLFTGATLMSIDNAADQQFLNGELPFLTFTTRVHWTGLFKQSTTWAYANGNPVDMSLFSWATEPDNVAGHEHCGLIRMTGAFSDRNCQFSYSNYVCKKPQNMYYPSDNIGCGSWIRAGRYCYNFMRSKSMSWQNARANCQSQSADLIKVDSLDKKSWLEVQMSTPDNDRVMWSGLNDIANEGTYVWADGTPVNQDYINWNQEPNDYKGDEDCGIIYSNGEYNDMSCTAHAAAICELDSQGSCPPGWLSRAADSGTGYNCYFLTPYSNYSLTYTKSEASDYCTNQAVSATAVPALLSVSTQSEKAFIKSTLAPKTDNPYGWWTSLNDLQSEGFWAFGDNTFDQTLIDWQGEPSNSTGNEDCGFINWSGVYHQRNCDITIGFICERPMFGYNPALGPGPGGSNSPVVTGTGSNLRPMYISVVFVAVISALLR